MMGMGPHHHSTSGGPRVVGTLGGAQAGADAGDGAGGNYYSGYEFNEFLAQEVLIEIVPIFGLDQVIEGMGGNYGPFTPNVPVTVPLWIALLCKETGTCAITCPEYLTVHFLKERLEKESIEMAFCPLFYHFFEVAHSLLRYARADIDQADEVSKLVADIRHRRDVKIENTYKVLDNRLNVAGLNADNLTSFEVDTVRRSVVNVMNNVMDLQNKAEPVALKQLPKTTGRYSTGSSGTVQHEQSRQQSGRTLAMSSEEGGDAGGATGQRPLFDPTQQGVGTTRVESDASTTRQVDTSTNAVGLSEEEDEPAPQKKKRRTLRKR